MMNNAIFWSLWCPMGDTQMGWQITPLSNGDTVLRIKEQDR